MAVKVSGAVLASLFYDQSSSSGDQYGFLIGESVQQVKDTISDSQINNVEVETKIYVFDSVPCEREMFYKPSSEMTSQHLVNLLPDKHQNIVGWYSFRRNSTLRPSYRERLFHCRLANLISQDGLLFFLCSAKSSSNKSTHTFDHTFLHLNNNMFKKMSVDIINLGDTTHSDYLTIPSHTVSSRHGAFSRIIHQQEKEFLNPQGLVEVKRIQNLNKSISKQLQQISNDVSASESHCSQLEVEVSRLRRRAKLKMLETQQEAGHHHQPRHSTPETRGPSVDDILRMDESDDASTEALIDQGPPTTGQAPPTTTGQAPPTTADDCETDEENMETDNNVSSHHVTSHHVTGVHSLPGKQVNTELSDKFSAHKRSSSNPHDSDSVLTRHSRSKSNEAFGDTTSTTQGSGLKQNDLCSFIGDIMAAELKKGPTKSGSKNNTEGNLHTSRQANEKVLRSQRIQDQKVKSEQCRTGSPQRTGYSENQKVPGKDMKDYRTKPPAKHCGQEASKSSAIEIESDDSSCPDLDLTASPVY